jgi:parvulin-like peptidyl-prolyl isomerase
LLKQTVETKLAYLDFLRNVPPERLETIQEKLDEQFDETQLDKAMQKAGVNSPAELDQKLREFGSSLKKQRRAFAEQVLAREMVRQKVDPEEEVTHEEMLSYYREHEADYFVQSKARWEQLEIRFDKFPSKAEAYRALAELGNEVLRGAPFAEVARRGSHDLNAEKGGVQDWTTKGSLRAKVLDEALFSLPIGQLSTIIESDNAFHIVRVIQRQEDTVVPFEEAQVEIKEKIRKQRFREQMTAYLDKIREQTPVWTIFDQPSTEEIARPPAQPYGLSPR